MNLLKQGLAPITDDAWDFLTKEAETVLKTNLVGRRVVDVDGPLGFEFSAVNLGKLSETQAWEGDALRYGVRRVQPLVEVRSDFQLPVWDLDDLSRGADDLDVAPLAAACRRLVEFEDRAIFLGFEQAAVQGIAPASALTRVALPSVVADWPEIVARGLLELQAAGVGGPYALVLGTKAYQDLGGELAPYPPRRRIEELIEGPVLHSSILAGGVLISRRGGDFKLTVGLDPSLGYDTHDAKAVHLYLTETFTFRVLTPEATLVLEPIGA